MTEQHNQPKEDDAVLGRHALPPIGGVVLGGLAGIKQRFATDSADQKIVALRDALTYGQPGIDLLIQALADKSPEVQWTAYSLLRERAEPRIKQVLQEHLFSPSAEALDCSRLGGLLAVGDWKSADLETAAIMLRLSGRENAGGLRFKDIQRLPPQVLQTIDQLWLGCSNQHFGLSVQNQIWQSLGGTINADYATWYRFCNDVEWRMNDSWVEYNHLNFSLDAPKGHLPFLVVGGFGVVVCLQSLFSQLGK